MKESNDTADPVLGMFLLNRNIEFTSDNQRIEPTRFYRVRWIEDIGKYEILESEKKFPL